MKDNIQSLDKSEYIRFGRHIMLPEIGEDGQSKIKSARVLLIGVGGLGSPLGLYLVAAGVGEIGLVDHDVVDLSNLQRQVLYTTEDVGLPKVECAKKRLTMLYPEVKITTYQARLCEENAYDIVKNYDIVIDGTDNFETRFLVNDVCVFLKKPNIHASIYRFEGQATIFGMKDGPCYRCLYPEPPPSGLVPSCSEIGVLGVLPGIMASIQATEAIKLITGLGNNLAGRLLTYDALAMQFNELPLEKNPDCAICGSHPTINELKPVSYSCEIKPKQQRVRELSPHMLAEMMETDDCIVIDVRQAYEREICNIDGSINLPFESFKGAIDQLKHDQNIVLYCKSGDISKKAARMLLENNFPSVFSLMGGVTAWIHLIEPELTEY